VTSLLQTGEAAFSALMLLVRQLQGLLAHKNCSFKNQITLWNLGLSHEDALVMETAFFISLSSFSLPA